MPDKKRDMINSQNAGFFQDLVQRIKLIGRLMGDKRINFFLKLLPVGSLIYLVWPMDLAPGLALPVIGALDDAAILWLGTSLFLSLCPEEIVEEHMNILNKVVPGTWRDTGEKKSTEIIDVSAARKDEATDFIDIESSDEE